MAHDRRTAVDGIGALPHVVTRWAGSRWTSIAVALAIVVVLIVGVVGGFDHRWQTFVYTTGALVSLLMLFLLQNTTNRESKAILVKLDELIQATSGAREDVMGIEKHEVSDQEEIHDQLPPATLHKQGMFSQAGPGERSQCVGRSHAQPRKGSHAQELGKRPIQP
jgi:low affinity Fe/Cu permease